MISRKTWIGSVGRTPVLRGSAEPAIGFYPWKSFPANSDCGLPLASIACPCEPEEVLASSTRFTKGCCRNSGASKQKWVVIAAWPSWSGLKSFVVWSTKSGTGDPAFPSATISISWCWLAFDASSNGRLGILYYWQTTRLRFITVSLISRIFTTRHSCRSFARRISRRRYTSNRFLRREETSWHRPRWRINNIFDFF